MSDILEQMANINSKELVERDPSDESSHGGGRSKALRVVLALGK